MSQRKIMLIDGSSLAFRAFYSILNLDRFKNKAGLHTNALFSFNRMLENVLTQFKPTHILVAFDEGGPTFRTEKYSDYKGHRDKAPNEFREQMPYFRVLLDGFGIKYTSSPTHEADDIIGTLAKAADSSDQVIVISGDKDLIQLIDDHITVYITRKGVSELTAYTPDVLKEELDLAPQQFIDLKGLMGDSSDNYPGVTRVGEKTALKLLHQFGSIDNLYANLDELKPSKLKENLINDRDQAYMSKDLATIRTDVPLSLDFQDLEYKGKNIDQLVDFYRTMEFNQFLTNLLEESDIDASNLDEEEEDLPAFNWTYLTEIQPSHLPDNATYYAEILDDNYHFADIVGLAWYDIDNQQVYVTDWQTAIQSDLFAEWMGDERKKKIVYDSKREQVLLSRFGLKMRGLDFDTVIANYLVDPNRSHELPDMLAETGINATLQYDDIIYGKGAKRGVPDNPDTFHSHLANKVVALSALRQPLKQALQDSDMEQLYLSIDFPLTQVLADLEITGIKVNGEVLEKRNKELEKAIEEIADQIYQLAGEAFNINSPKQLGEILFEKLGLPVIKKTKTGYSTAASVLEKLVDKHLIIPKILEYRSLSKLSSTYLAPLPHYIKEDGKIHTRFVQTLTQTGRLSSQDPNLQNIPIRIEEGRRIRQAFVPSKPGWQLFGADYSQIELRVLAHISQDEHMLAAFNAGEDIHSATARRVFNIPSNQPITANQRRQAKAVNFGIVYGISDYGLSQNLNISRKEAQSFIDTYFENYPGVQQYMSDIVAEAREHGYVKTLFNRRRYLPDIKASNYNVRSFAERTAINSPIQGTAADILKIAMVELEQALIKRKMETKILLQVHDELILEGPAEEMEDLSDLVVEIMEGAAELDVPLKVDYNQGNNWYELK